MNLINVSIESEVKGSHNFKKTMHVKVCHTEPYVGL